MSIFKTIITPYCIMRNWLHTIGLLIGFVLLSGTTFAQFILDGSTLNSGDYTCGSSTIAEPAIWVDESVNTLTICPAAGELIYIDLGTIVLNNQGGNNSDDVLTVTQGATVLYTDGPGSNGADNVIVAGTVAGACITITLEIGGNSNATADFNAVINCLPAANAGSDQNPGDCGTSVTLSGNDVSPATGTWTYSGPDVPVYTPNANDPNAVVTGLTTAGVDHTFTWTSDDGNATHSDGMVFNSVGPGCAAYCTPVYPTGVFSIDNTTFAGINNSSTIYQNDAGGEQYEDFTGSVACGAVTQGVIYPLTVSATGLGANTFYVTAFIDWNGDGDFSDTGEEQSVGTYAQDSWTSSPLNITVPCNATPGNTRIRIVTHFSTAGLECETAGYGQAEDYCITITAAPVPIASATSNYVACGTTASLDASASSISDGYWSVISGSGTIASATSQITTISDLTNGTVTLQWTSIGTCEIDTDQTSFVVSGLPDEAIAAGDDQFGCVTSTTLQGSDPTPFTGLWVVSSGPNVPTFTPNANDPNATLGNLINGVYTLEWQINTGACGILTDNVSVTIGSVPSADAGPDQAVCPESAAMAATLPAGFVGTWTQTAGAAASILDANDPSTLMFDMTAAGTYTFQWEISGGGCTGTTTSSIDVVVTACQNSAPHSITPLTEFTGCNFLFTDDGGTGSDYSNNVLQTMTQFCPDDPNDFVTMTFNTINLAAGDFFHVYDEPSGGAPIVAYGYSGGLIPNAPITSSTGCLYVTFFSNSATTAPGWEADITCTSTPGTQYGGFVSGDNCGGGGGITVCEAGSYPTVNSNAGSPQDIGNGSAGGSNGCLPSGEGNSQFVYFNIVTSGHLSFGIDPAGGQDFDFMIWGPYDGGIACPGFTGDSPIRCTWALNAEAFCPWGSEAQIGLSYTSPVATPAAVLPSDTIEGLGSCVDGPGAEDGWLYPIDAQAGEVYVMLVQNFAQNAANWTFSYDDTDPTAAGLGCTPPVLLPVSLASFFGENVNRANKLYWITVSELNNDFFTIERSFDGINWEFLGEVDGAGTVEEGHDYSFIDLDPYVGVTYYRLKQTDFNGVSKSHGVIALNMTLDDNTFSNVFPNPSDQSFYFMYGGESLNIPIEITLFDNSGKEIYRDEVVQFNKSQGITVDISKLTNGIYQVQLVQGESKNYQRISILHE